MPVDMIFTEQLSINVPRHPSCTVLSFWITLTYPTRSHISPGKTYQVILRYQWTFTWTHWTLYNYTLNDNLAAIFEAKLKAAIDNQEPQKSTIFIRCFQH